MKSDEFVRQLGARLRAERKQAGLSQDAMARAMGQTASSGHAYISRMESGELGDVGFLMVTRYLQACKAPIGKFMLELAQSGAFGEAEVNLSADYADFADGGQSSPSSSLKLMQEKRAKAKLLYEKRWEREAQDADIIARLWNEVQVAIRPLLPNDPTIFLTPYLEGVRMFYRAWKQAVRGVVNRDPVLDVQMAFDRIEQAGVQRLVPAAVRKMREVVFERLMSMLPGAAGRDSR